MTVINLQADARRLPLPDDSVDLVVTSPPYWVLRDYQDDGGSLAGQIGNETTYDEWLDVMLDCVREWQRVLKPSASLFINCGDKYLDKELVGLPWRLALRCIDDLDLILRAEIIWSKPNGLPESVTDRVRRSHEQIFHFTLQPRYYSAVDEIREEQTTIVTTSGAVRYRKPGETLEPRRKTVTDSNKTTATGLTSHIKSAANNPLGKLPGSVWTIPSTPLKLPEKLGIDHFAAFPPDLVRPIIVGWSPPGVCVECGEGRRPTSTGETQPTQRTHNGYTRGDPVGQRGGMVPLPMRRTTTITGYACACHTPTASTRPSVVLDPFGGTGTTALVASTHGRIGVSVDLSHDYCRVAQWRTHDPGERARAMKVEKPPPVLEGQQFMFEGVL